MTTFCWFPPGQRGPPLHHPRDVEHRTDRHDLQPTRLVRLDHFDHLVHGLPADRPAVIRQLVVPGPIVIARLEPLVRSAHRDRDVVPAECIKKFRHHLQLVPHAPEVDRHQLHVQLRRADRQRQRPGVVDVLAEIGVVDDPDRLAIRLSEGGRGHRLRDDPECEACNDEPGRMGHGENLRMVIGANVTGWRGRSRTGPGTAAGSRPVGGRVPR